MTLGMAIVLFVLAVAGIVLTCRYFRENRKLRTICLLFLTLAAVALACYIGLTAVFIDAVRNRPADL